MRIAIGLAYDGSRFEGWQTQPSGHAIQDHVETALTRVADAPIRTIAAGRTDARVHATGQVVHFDTDARRPLGAWVRGVNAHLPDAIAAQWSTEVPEDFHARFSARSRRYAYVLYSHPVRPSVFAGRVGWDHHVLDVDAMRKAASALEGEHDFSSFRSAECQAKTPVKRLAHASIEVRPPYLVFTFTADAFLHHMVRNIVGALVYVGCGKHSSAWMRELLHARDRRLAPPTFAPDGLYLTGVEYDPRFAMPAAPAILPWLLPSAPA